MAIKNTCLINMAAAILISGLLCLSTPVKAQSADIGPITGQPLDDVLQRYSNVGIKLLYSSNYVLPTMIIGQEPAESEPVQQLSEILLPFGLKLKQTGDSYLIVKTQSGEPVGALPSIVVILRHPETISNLEAVRLSVEPEIGQFVKHGAGLYEYFPLRSGDYKFLASLAGYSTAMSKVQYSGSSNSLAMIDLKVAPPGIEEINVSASRYILFSSSEYVIDQKSIEVLPLMARDPVRAAQNIQGTAAGGLSAKSHYRGGVDNESSIYLNGLRLLEPFHIRDYHSIFSSIGAEIVSSIQVYTGGFPVEYGGDMSGVMLLQSKIPEEPMQTELGLSLFYASILNTGRSENEDWDWLISARRSNLEYVLKPEYGEPEYFDVFTTLGFNPNDQTRITLNVLYTDDEVDLIIESDPAELEQSVSDMINKTIWLALEHDWSPRLSASTSLALTEFSNRRVASVNDPEELLSSVTDFRNMNRLGFRQDLKFESNFGHTFKGGLEFNRQKASYRYHGQAEYFGLVANSPDIQNPKAYQIEVDPKGNSYAVYLSDRVLLSDRMSMELGLRWDKQTYTKTGDSSQLSPRASVLYDFQQFGELRLSAGRYYQAQQIQALQVEDDVDHFFPAQYADQLIGGYQWNAFTNYSFRAEVYYKKYNDLTPRFENLFDSLQLTPEFQPDRVMLVPDSAVAKGLEFSVEFMADEQFSWWASYAWSKVTDSINGVDQRRSWDQPHALQAGLAWQLGAWDIGLAARIHTGWPMTALEIAIDPATGDPYPLAGPRNTERLENFASFDFRVSRQFDIRWGSLTGFIEVTNATNRSNQCCIDYGEETDSTGQVILTSAAESWLPIVPSIGVVWQF